MQVYHRPPEFEHLRFGQETIPEPLQKMIRQTLFAVEKAKLRDIAPQEIGKRPGSKRKPVVEPILREALDARLRTAGAGGYRVVSRKQAEFFAQPSDRLACRIFIV